ncbi:hypothetical protein CBR_g4448 [Chara braunii]|uniref:Uncharacterized protein n=1 Tax=Chara braunii TaxID=69332 RepID=A0A388KHY5_CHABU|nr:hypothetical protein CBR_g4448 [Chara braunii]|eukprot:GBG69618.1 hypothetical protein CBR_g4448 [Chara braunii]
MHAVGIKGSVVGMKVEKLSSWLWRRRPNRLFNAVELALHEITNGWRQTGSAPNFVHRPVHSSAGCNCT